MQTVQQLWQIFKRHGRHALLLLSFVWMPAVISAQTEFDFSEPVLAQNIMDREKSLINEPTLADFSVLLREHEQIALAEPPPVHHPNKEILEVPFEIEIPACVPLTRSKHSFIYPPQQRFIPNPLTAEKITLPHLPYTLTPFGRPPKKKPASVAQKIPKKIQLVETEVTKKEGKPQADQKHEIVAMSPFLEWVKENNEKAAEIARENAKKYKKEIVIDSKDEANADLFLNIRFPYRGPEPSGKTTAIYSTPEK